MAFLAKSGGDFFFFQAFYTGGDANQKDWVYITPDSLTAVITPGYVDDSEAIAKVSIGDYIRVYQCSNRRDLSTQTRLFKVKVIDKSTTALTLEVDSVGSGEIDEDIIPFYSTKAIAAAADIPLTRTTVLLGGLNAAGDGHSSIYKQVASLPSHEGYFASTNGKFYELALPTEYETLDLEYYLRRRATTPAGHMQAVTDAFTDLYNTGTNGIHLKCSGIPLTFNAPVRLRTDLLNFNRTGLKISGMTIQADTGGTWSHLDYLFSIAGATSNDRPNRLIIDDYYADINELPIVGLHVACSYHTSIYRPIVRGLSGTDLTDFAIGILSGQYTGTSGEGNNGGTSVSSHGTRIFEADIDGSGDTAVAIQIESGDADIEGGWCTNVGVGLIAYGGLNIRGMHWSMGVTGAGDRRAAVIFRGGAAALSIHDTELDKSYIVVDARTNLAGNVAASDLNFTRISMSGLKFSATNEPLPAVPDLHDGSTVTIPAGLQNGYVVFVARQANTTFSPLSIKSDWNSSSTGDLVGFATVAPGSFDATLTNTMRVERAGQANATGNMPADMRLFIAGNNLGQCQFQPNRASGPAERVIATGNGKSAAMVVEGSQPANTPAYAELELNNRADAAVDRGIARVRAYRDGANSSTKLALTTMLAGVESDTLTVDSAAVATLTTMDAGAGAGPVLDLFRDSASPAVSDIVADVQFHGRNNAAADITYANVRATLLNVTGGAEAASLDFRTMVAGTLSTRWSIGASGHFVPNADNTYDLGSTGAGVKDAYLKGVLKISSTQVVRARITGWTADTGTDRRGANATYSGTAEVGYTQATIQTLMDEVRDLSRTIKSLKDDLMTHGLIGT